ncbi:MAG: tetratricopeptide repeat protein, partial [Pirellulales bacterium]|nr:tetratricopeptide repeat protein [Pirellulales bacterium]
GRIATPELAAERLRELEILHARAAKGTEERLHMAHKLAQTLWNYDKQDRAIDLLADALSECQIQSNEPIDCFVGFLENKGHFTRGETFLKDRLTRSTNKLHKNWLTLRLYRTYEAALNNNGQVSLGQGDTLYKAAHKAILEDIRTEDHNHRCQLIDRLLSIYRTYDRKKPNYVDLDLMDFAFKRLPKILQRQTNNQESIIRNTAETLKDLVGYREGLAFLIERLENEPSWWRYQHRDGWNQYGWQLGQWRENAKPLGDLEPRLLAIVTAELRRDLETRQQRNRVMYWQHHGHFWKEKTDDFARAAEEVLAERKDSSAAVTYIAEYLFEGLDRHDRAIAILLDAHRRKVLDENGQSRLVDFLHRRDRYGESIAILLPLIELRPDNMRYRVQLMHAYFRTNQREALLDLLAKTDAYFHKENRWNENAMSELGRSCLANQLFEQSVEYYKELIPLHQRTQPQRGIGNGTLSLYYMNLARAYAGLKNTVEAVDAAGAAIVAWGPRHDRRQEAVNTLVDVLRGSPDLDAYVAELDKSVEETGMENPIVRKHLGQVYMERGKFEKAAAQLKLAVESQPNDAGTYKKLIACYDAKKDKTGAIAQLLQWVQLNRRDIELYADLGRRYTDLEKSKQAERAYTSIVEMQPKESESHARLAKIRQEQNRWPEAIEHWRQVAEIRGLEPTGLLNLAKAQVHLKQWNEATETLKKLKARSWPNRFSNVPSEVQTLEQTIEHERQR